MKGLQFNVFLCFIICILCFFSLKDSFNSPDVFKDVLPACQQMQDIVTKVFDNNAEHVLAKFVQYVFEKKLAVCINHYFLATFTKNLFLHGIIFLCSSHMINYFQIWFSYILIWFLKPLFLHYCYTKLFGRKKIQGIDFFKSKILLANKNLTWKKYSSCKHLYM